MKRLLMLALSVQLAGPANARLPGTRSQSVITLGVSDEASLRFVRGNGGWGMQLAGPGVPRITQPDPARIELYTGGNDTRMLAVPYASVERTAKGVTAIA
jgi:hypothetical protein